MNVILTSFGIGMNKTSEYSPFYRMPPLLLEERTTSLQLDYAALFIFDRVIIDEYTYFKDIDPNLERFEHYPHDVVQKIQKAAEEYSAVLRLLEKSGRLVLKNFDRIFSKTKTYLSDTTEMDVASKNIAKWIKPLELSFKKWLELVSKLRFDRDEYSNFKEGRTQDTSYLPRAELLHSLGGQGISSQIYLEWLREWKKKLSPSMRDSVRRLLRDYLSYVNFNLLLSFELDCPFVDWIDFQPFYDYKFQNAFEHHTYAKIADHSKKLFDLLFPYFIPKSPKELISVIENRKLDKLRDLIKESVKKNIEFDNAFAVNTLKEVIKLEQKATLRRRISGWATLPLGFIPVVGTPVQKTTEETINSIWADKPLKEYSWFYLINDLDVSKH